MSALNGTEPALVGYRGRDRRAVARGIAINGRALIEWAVAGAGGLLLLSSALALLTPGPTIDLWPIALAFWCTLVLGAGVALIVAWRVGGWARPGQLGTALVALALWVSLLPRFSDIVAPVQSLQSIRPLGTTIVIVVAVGHIARSLRKDDVDTTIHPVAELLGLIAVMLVAILAGSTVLMVADGRVQDAVKWAPATACLVGAGLTLVAGRCAPRVVTRGVAAMLVLMGVASVVRYSSSADVVQALGTTTMGTSAWLAVGIARDRLRWALATQDARSLQTLATLGRFSSEVSRERERRHDALNALAAIRSAAEVLTSSGQDLDPATRAELSLAARAEIARVERMLAPATAAPRDMRLAEVLRPVLLARRQRGLDIDADLGEVQVRAVPDIVARIVGNLLQNVERHAVGSGVRIVAEESGVLVRLSVSDNGPGIPAQRRDQIFDTGTTSCPQGQGLGLQSALRLARDQGGDLQLVGSDSGCCFVLTLPSTAGGSGSAMRPMHAQAG